MTTISFNTASTTLNNGYALAGFQVVLAMQRMGIKVPFLDTSAPAMLQFCQPHYWADWGPNQYRIGYVPWESSALPVGWLEKINETDEFWTPSALCKRWYEEAGVTVPIRVYPHGIDHEAWAPKRRRSFNKLKFLHNGAGAERKGAQQALDAFVAAFGKQDDVQLTLKGVGTNLARAKFGGSIYKPEEIHKNVIVDLTNYPIEQLPSLYYQHHVFVANSAGEGFGLPGLEGVASGMPTIINPEWAPYREQTISQLHLATTLQPSPWPGIHPGNMYVPEFDSLVEAYRYAYDNFDELSRIAYRKSLKAHAIFDWDILTRQAFEPVIAKING